MAASNGGRSRSSICARGASIVTGASSVFASAEPMPGKCLAVVATPAARAPRIDARTRAATSAGVPANVRPANAAGPAVTSATGREVDVQPEAAQLA